MTDYIAKMVAVYSGAHTDHSYESLKNLSEELQIPLVDSYSDDFDFYLQKIDDLLYLQSEETQICVDFSSGEANYRREYGGGKNQPIGRAIGLNKRKDITVLDATAGLGGDSFVLACLGCQVTMLERSPIISALLGDGLRRGLLDENIKHLIEKMNLINVDAKKYFSQIKIQATSHLEAYIEKRPDVIYLDPMYPHRKKSAKVKKEMQMLQLLLGHDEDASFLALAIEVAGKRVVVKRPKGAEYLNDLTPTHSIESKKTRYDVYITP